MEAVINPPHSANPDDVRRERKRAHDRRAQRVARERTKSRIAQLEATVAVLRRQECDDRSAGLTEQVDAITTERDELAAILSDVEAAVRKYKERSRHKSIGGTQGEELLNMSRDPDNQPIPREVPIDAWPGISVLELDMQELDDEPSSYPSEPYADGVEIEPVVTQSDNLLGLRPNESSPTSTDVFSRMVLDSPSTISQTQDSILPRSEIPCECTPHLPVTATSRGNGNIWRSANAILGEPQDLSKAILHYDDTTGEDIAIRAILGGWNAVEQSIQLLPIWKKLRRIDELQFNHCADTERLAVLSTMHLMLKYHADPTLERWSKLPSWMQKRPCQTAIAHSYAINFFVWPGLRERFVFSQHRYCSNIFWEYFTANLSIIWPYEFRDCYKSDIETGKVSISTDFKTRIADLNAWTMGPDFFQRFPDLYTDIPASKGIPKQLYMNNPSSKGVFTSFDHEQEHGGRRVAHPSNKRGAGQAFPCREYSDENWLRSLPQLGSNSEQPAFDENLRLGLF